MALEGRPTDWSTVLAELSRPAAGAGGRRRLVVADARQRERARTALQAAEGTTPEVEVATERELAAETVAAAGGGTPLADALLDLLTRRCLWSQVELRRLLRYDAGPAALSVAVSELLAAGCEGAAREAALEAWTEQGGEGPLVPSLLDATAALAEELHALARPLGPEVFRRAAAALPTKGAEVLPADELWWLDGASPRGWEADWHEGLSRHPAARAVALPAVESPDERPWTEHDDPRAEARHVGRRLLDLIDEGVAPEDLVVVLAGGEGVRAAWRLELAALNVPTAWDEPTVTAERRRVQRFRQALRDPQRSTSWWRRLVADELGAADENDVAVEAVRASVLAAREAGPVHEGLDQWIEALTTAWPDGRTSLPERLRALRDGLPEDLVLSERELPLLVDAALAEDELDELGPGVAILAPARAAVGLRAEAVFLAGLAEPTFPAAPGRRRLLGWSERRALASVLPDLDPERRREREQVDAWMVAAPRVELSSARHDENGLPGEPPGWLLERERRGETERRETTTSGEVVTRTGRALATETAELDLSHRRLREARRKGPGWIQLGLLGGDVRPDGALSVTQVEEVAACPWRWFVQRRLEAAPPEPPEELPEVTPPRLGRLVHAALEAAAKAAGLPVRASLAATLESDHGVTLDATAIAAGVEEALRLDEETDGALPEVLASWLRERLRAYLEPLGTEREWLGAELNGSWTIDEVTVGFRVDAVERDGAGLVLSDFKTGAPRLSAKTASGRRRSLLKRVGAGDLLQPIVHAMGAGSPDARGRLFHLRPDVDDALRELVVRADDSEMITVASAAVHAVHATLAEGVLPPRLVEGDEEPACCSSCRVSLACRRGTPGLRETVVEWLDSEPASDEGAPLRRCRVVLEGPGRAEGRS
ncbi:MAG: PD-(D/E)XK nuclease family protein [Acidobacteriota bacterium]